jgi:2-iminobutanoate/2-iminopropanoate deaminase
MKREVLPNVRGLPSRVPGMVPGVRAGGFVFFSAVRGRHPITGLIDPEPLEQARQALDVIKLSMQDWGGTLDHVVKVTLYLSDLSKRAIFHQAWLEYFPQDPPARIAICVADANVELGGTAHFALDVIALDPAS